MKRLVKEGLITTILGLGVLCFCGILIYQEKQSADQLSGWFAFGLTLLRAKDSILGLKNKEE